MSGDARRGASRAPGSTIGAREDVRKEGVTLRTSSQASQWDGGPRALVIVLAVMVALAVALYRYGVPFVARTAAEQIPASALARSTADFGKPANLAT